VIYDLLNTHSQAYLGMGWGNRDSRHWLERSGRNSKPQSNAMDVRWRAIRNNCIN